MIFPLITQKEIGVEEPRQTAIDYQSGSYRLVARLELGADCRVSDFTSRHSYFNMKEHAIRLLKTRILRRLYPLEIGREIHDIRNHFCCMPDSYIRYDVARELNDRLRALEDALRPDVK